MSKPGKWAIEHLALVSSYGLMWDRQKTEWPRVVGRRNGRIADFSEQMGLYILYKGTDPRYVGVADRLGSRIGRHERDHLTRRWDHVSWFGSTVVPDGGKNSKVSIPFPNPRHRPIVVVPKRTWHDLEAILFFAFGFSVADDLNARRAIAAGGNHPKVPYFGGNALEWKQVVPDEGPLGHVRKAHH